jgi:hypothetical protein
VAENQTREARDVGDFSASLGWIGETVVRESKPKTKYAEVEAATKAAGDARRKQIEVENAYLESRGFKVVLDHEKSEIRWQFPPSMVVGGDYVTCHRSSALDSARGRELSDKAKAEKEIARLKAEHGIEG